jgi:transposase-like protein
MGQPQRRRFSDEELRKIIRLLQSTELSISQIAERMNCKPPAIAAINRRFEIRDYGGRRNEWLVMKN